MKMSAFLNQCSVALKEENWSHRWRSTIVKVGNGVCLLIWTAGISLYRSRQQARDHTDWYECQWNWGRLLGTVRVPNTSSHYLQITVEGIWNVDNRQQLVVEQISVPTPITTAGAASPEDRSKERDAQLSAANEKYQHYDFRTFQTLAQSRGISVRESAANDTNQPAWGT